MRSVQYSGIPKTAADPAVEAGIVALKSRTIAPAEAVSQSLRALEWLLAQGCRQILFKYCSTFDSTPEGNIGPVAEALADALGASHVVVCPAYPTLKRSIFCGHLFVGDKLLSESGMENHPLTPMTDPDLRRWLARQTRGDVGHIPAAVVFAGGDAIKAALTEPQAPRLLVVDCVRDEDLIEIGAAAADEKLITGGSGIALGLPAVYRARGLIGTSIAPWMPVNGPGVVLSGSCSTATRGQVAYHRNRHPSLEITADEVMAGTMDAESAARWALGHGGELPLIYSSADPAVVQVAQQRHGRHEVAAALEQFMGETARRLADAGVRRIVSAGGETSGAVTDALAVAAMEIGPEIDLGVPALRVVDRQLALALKSGNFGAEDFFERAAGALGEK